MTNEKDREKLEEITSDVWRYYDQGRREKAIQEISRIIAEAVKAEREKIAALEARIAELTKPYNPDYPEPKAYISDGPRLDSFLSDDQEARNASHS